MTTILNGLLGGLIIGAIAAVATRLVADELSVTAAVLQRTFGSDAPSSRWMEFVVQILYGCLAGGVLLALELYVLGMLSVPPTAIEAFGVSVVWSALLFGVLSLIVLAASERSSTRTHLIELFVYHLVYGLGLGLWIRMTWIT